MRGDVWRWVSTSGHVHTFESVDRRGIELVLDDLGYALEAAKPGYELVPEYYGVGRVAARVAAAAQDLHDLPPREVPGVLRRLAWCEGIEERFRARLCTWSDASMAIAVGAMFMESVNEALADGAEGAKTRAGSPLALSAPPSVRQIRRWLERFRDGGRLPVALRQRHFLAGDRSQRFTPEVHGLIAKAVRLYASPERPTLAACHLRLADMVRQLDAARAPSGATPLPCPSIHSLRAAIRKLGPFEVCAARHGLETARRRFQPLGRGLDVDRPGQRIEMDEWSIQLMALLVELRLWDDLGPEDRAAAARVRLWICLAVDAATRCPLGLSIAEAPSAANCVECLSMVVRDKRRISQALGCESAWDMACTPETVVCDSGSSFRSSEFRAAVAGIGAVRVILPAGQPGLRGRNERVFSTLNKQWLALIPGRTFSNVVDRGRYDAGANAVMSPAALRLTLVRFLVDVHVNRPHSGLGGETPRDCWTRLTRERRVRPLVGAIRARHVFGVEVLRKVDRHGVAVLGLDYSSELLESEWRGRHLGQVRVRMDPSDLGAVSVWVGKGWIHCPCRREGFAGVPMSTWAVAEADLARRHGAGAKLSEATVLRALEAIDAVVADEAVRTGLDLTRVRPADIDALQARMTIGFSLPGDDGRASTDGGDLFDGAVEATGPDGPRMPDDVPATDATFEVEREDPNDPAGAAVDGVGGPPPGPTRGRPFVPEDDEPRPSATDTHDHEVEDD